MVGIIEKYLDLQGYGYGKWFLVVSLVLLSLFFITKYLPLKTKFEKRSGGVLTAFFTALFIEMFGFPLTIYLLSSFFGIKIPLTNEKGHLFGDLLTYLGLGNGTLIVMVVSAVMITFGVSWVVAGWRLVYHSKGKLVTKGIYAKMRHPQYSGLFLIIIGFLIQWPTLITVIMFPFLIVMYYNLAKREEEDIEKKYKKQYKRYKEKVPMFLPRFKILRGLKS